MLPDQFSFFLNRPDINVRCEILQVLCERYKEENAHLRKYESSVERLHRVEVQLAAERAAAVKELEIERESHKRSREECSNLKNEIQRLKQQLDNENMKRQKFRSSFNELNRVLPQEVREDEKTNQVLRSMQDGLKV
jgi:chromosome segregation ATPase